MKKLKDLKTLLKHLPKKYLIVAGSFLVAITAIITISLLENDNKQVKIAEEQLVVLIDNIRQQYRNRPDAWGLNTDFAIKNHLAPQNMLKNNKIFNDLGQEVVIGGDISGSTVMPGQRNFVVAFKDVNKNRCVQMTTNPLSDKLQLGLDSIVIANDTQNIFQWGGNKALPISQTDAKTACKKNNTIIWYVNL